MIFRTRLPRQSRRWSKPCERAAGTAKHDVTSPTVGQILAPIFDAAAKLRREPGAPHHGQEAEIAQAVIDKFARQGLTL
jgi:hypothetical protein